VNHDPRPIGVYDSGIGGLSVWREIARQLPDESTVYLGDQGNFPYGPRSIGEIQSFAGAITRFLLHHDAKIIVVACNTASGASLHYLRAAFPEIQFVGMEPAIKPAAERTHTGAIGIIATPTTFQGALFRSLVERFAAQVRLETQMCPGLADAVEAGALDTPETLELLHRYLDPMVAAGIDHLVLGCTHYPFLQPAIEQVVGPDITIVDAAPAVARQIGRVLTAREMTAPPGSTGRHHFYTTGDPAGMTAMMQRLIGYTGKSHGVTWENGEIHL